MNPHTEREERRCIGQGGFGAVYKATWRHQAVAVKELTLTHLTGATEREFMNEVQVMLHLRVTQVVALYGITLRPRYGLVMAYCEGGSLFDYLHSGAPIHWSTRIRIALEVAQGLAFLHACTPPILHRDLKSHNILLDKDRHAKIADFGLSRVKQETQSLTTTAGAKETVGSIPWMAPELFKRGAKYVTGSDMYSYGMVLWELSSRQVPWSDARAPGLIIQWVSQGEREDMPTDAPEPIAAVIRSCWEANPMNRPSAGDVIQSLNALTQTEVMMRATAATEQAGAGESVMPSGEFVPSTDSSGVQPGNAPSPWGARDPSSQRQPYEQGGTSPTFFEQPSVPNSGVEGSDSPHSGSERRPSGSERRPSIFSPAQGGQ